MEDPLRAFFLRWSALLPPHVGDTFMLDLAVLVAMEQARERRTIDQTRHEEGTSA